MVVGLVGCGSPLILVWSGEGGDAPGFRRRLMRTQLGERIVRPAALSFRRRWHRGPHRLLLAKLARRQAEAVAKRPAEMRGIAEAVAERDLRNRPMRLGGIGQIGPGPLQPPLADIMGEIVADAFEQLLQIALGDALGLGDARRR